MSRIRLLFAKKGLASFISHQDLPELFSRSARRSGLICEWTQGFSPHPRLVLGPPLPMGVNGEKEPAEFWFQNWESDSLDRWNRCLIQGITLLDAQDVDGASLGKECDTAEYRILSRDSSQSERILSAITLELEKKEVLLNFEKAECGFTVTVSDIEKASPGSFVRFLKEQQLIAGWQDLIITRLSMGRWDALSKTILSPLIWSKADEQ